MQKRANSYFGKICLFSACAMPAGFASIAHAAIYNAAPTVVYTASSSTGFDGANFAYLTVGLNSSTNVSPLINLDSAAIAGYDVNTTSGSSGYKELYYFVPSTSSVSIVALNDSGHNILSTSGSAANPSLDIDSATGTIVGTQGRNGYDGSGNFTSLGTDTFTSTSGGTPTVIPLPTTVLGGGATYSYTNAATGLQAYTMTTNPGTTSGTSFNTNEIGTGGVVTGTVARVAGNTYTAQPGAVLGTDGYYYNPVSGTTVAIGLSGTNYTYHSTVTSDNSRLTESTSVTGTAGLNAAGYTQRVTSTGTSLGYDSWIYTPSNNTTTQIGLVGAGYSYTDTSGNTTETSQTFRTNAAGQIAGKSTQYPSSTSSNGTVAWLYTPSATPGTASTFGTSSSGSYSQLGLNATASGTTLGNIGPAGFVNNNITFLSTNGHAAGTSNRYDSAGNFQGLTSWYYAGGASGSSADMSPSGPYDLYASGGTVYSSNTVTAINNTTMAAGYATRVAGTATGSAALGQDAYVYDSATGISTLVDPTDANSSNYELSFIGSLSDTGVAVGYFNTYSGTTSSTITGTDLFAWSLANGLQVLGTYPSSQASNMASYTASFEFGADGNLYGPSAPGSTSASSIVRYSTAVPEPSTLALLTIGSLSLLRRRSVRSV